MGHRPGTTKTVVSTALFLVVSATCLSYWSPRPLAIHAISGDASRRSFGLEPTRFGISFGWYDPALPPYPTVAEYDDAAVLRLMQRLPREGSVQAGGFYVQWNTPVFRTIPHGRSAGVSEVMGNAGCIILPAWFLLAVTGLLPAARIWRWQRRRRGAPDPNRCSCGYDLRATPTR
jgi:hypothetical protein